MFWPWLVEIGIITWRDIPGLGSIGPLKIKGTAHTVGSLPAPGDYLATFIIMAPLAALADTRARNFAVLTGWAFVLASLLNVLDPSDPLGRQQGANPVPQQAAAAGGFSTGTAPQTQAQSLAQYQAGVQG